MENEAVKIVDFQSFSVSNIHERASVKRRARTLFHHENAVIQKLPLEDGMHVMEKNLQMFLTISAK